MKELRATSHVFTRRADTRGHHSCRRHHPCQQESSPPIAPSDERLSPRGNDRPVPSCATTFPVTTVPVSCARHTQESPASMAMTLKLCESCGQVGNLTGTSDPISICVFGSSTRVNNQFALQRTVSDTRVSPSYWFRDSDAMPSHQHL